MKLLIMIMLLYHTHRINGNTIPSDNQSSVIGGTPAKFHQFPFMAYLKISLPGEVGECSGTILSDIFILTAAHCLLGTIKLIIITIGNINYENGDDYFTKKYYRNALYFGPEPDNDVGIVKAEENMKLDGVNSKTVKLADKSFSVQTLSHVTVVGWGATREGGEESADLNSVTLPVISLAACRAAYRRKANITTRSFCAGDLKRGGIGSCVGDSGGPAIDTVAGVQVGIVSAAVGCGRAAFPSIFTNVAPMRTYIHFVTGL